MTDDPSQLLDQYYERSASLGIARPLADALLAEESSRLGSDARLSEAVMAAIARLEVVAQRR